MSLEEARKLEEFILEMHRRRVAGDFPALCELAKTLNETSWFLLAKTGALAYAVLDFEKRINKVSELADCLALSICKNMLFEYAVEAGVVKSFWDAVHIRNLMSSENWGRVALKDRDEEVLNALTKAFVPFCQIGPDTTMDEVKAIINWPVQLPADVIVATCTFIAEGFSSEDEVLSWLEMEDVKNSDFRSGVIVAYAEEKTKTIESALLLLKAMVADEGFANCKSVRKNYEAMMGVVVPLLDEAKKLSKEMVIFITRMIPPIGCLDSRLISTWEGRVIAAALRLVWPDKNKEVDLHDIIWAFSRQEARHHFIVSYVLKFRSRLAAEEAEYLIKQIDFKVEYGRVAGWAIIRAAKKSKLDTGKLKKMVPPPFFQSSRKLPKFIQKIMDEGNTIGGLDAIGILAGLGGGTIFTFSSTEQAEDKSGCDCLVCEIIWQFGSSTYVAEEVENLFRATGQEINDSVAVHKVFREISDEDLEKSFVTAKTSEKMQDVILNWRKKQRK